MVPDNVIVNCRIIYMSKPQLAPSWCSPHRSLTPKKEEGSNKTTWTLLEWKSSIQQTLSRLYLFGVGIFDDSFNEEIGRK